VHRHARAPVLRQDPALLGVRLADVDEQEAGSAAVPAGDPLQRPNLGAKRWSGERAEDERDRPGLEQRTEPHRAAPVDLRSAKSGATSPSATFAVIRSR